MSAYARKSQNISTEQILRERHTSDKNGIWYDMPPYVKRPYDRCLHVAAARSRPKSNLTYALTLMDKIGGWNDEKWIGPKFAACVRIYTKQYVSTSVVVNRLWT